MFKRDGISSRSIKVRVYALFGEKKSAYAEITATNAQTPQVRNFKAEPGVKSIHLSCDIPQQNDNKGFLWWISTNPNFSPTVSNATVDTTSNYVYISNLNNKELDTSKTYYAWVAAYDMYGKDGLNISSYQSINPLVIKLDPESITAEMIANGSLDKTKFAEDVNFPKIVENLPPTGNEGDLVINRGKLYIRRNSKWELPVSDISDIRGSINVSRLSGMITGEQIQANAIGANHIATEAIQAGHIGVGAVGADQIASNAISTKHLAITDFTELFPDPYFSHADDKKYWKYLPINLIEYGFKLSNNEFRGKYLIADGPHKFTDNSGWIGPYTEVKVNSNTRYAIRFNGFKRGKFSGKVRVVAYILKKDKVINEDDNVREEFDLTTYDLQTYSMVIKTKADTEYIRIYIQVNRVGGAAIGEIHLKEVQATIIEPGSITTEHLKSGLITSDKLASNSVVAGKIAANAITAGSAIIADGAITNAKIANLSVDKFKLKNNEIDFEKIRPNALSVVAKKNMQGYSGSISFTTREKGNILIIIYIHSYLHSSNNTSISPEKAKKIEFKGLITDTVHVPIIGIPMNSEYGFYKSRAISIPVCISHIVFVDKGSYSISYLSKSFENSIESVYVNINILGLYR